jgi:hypothetical protein
MNTNFKNEKFLATDYADSTSNEKFTEWRMTKNRGPRVTRIDANRFRDSRIILAQDRRCARVLFDRGMRSKAAQQRRTPKRRANTPKARAPKKACSPPTRSIGFQPIESIGSDADATSSGPHRPLSSDFCPPFADSPIRRFADSGTHLTAEDVESAEALASPWV